MRDLASDCLTELKTNPTSGYTKSKNGQVGPKLSGALRVMGTVALTARFWTRFEPANRLPESDSSNWNYGAGVRFCGSIEALSEYGDKSLGRVSERQVFRE